VVDRAHRLLAADRAAVFEFDRERRSLLARTSRGFPQDELAAWTIGPGEGLIGEAFRDGRPLSVSGARGNDPFLVRFASAYARAGAPAVVGLRGPLRAVLAWTCEAACRVLGATAAVAIARGGEEVVRASHGLDEASLADWPLEPEGEGATERSTVRAAGGQ